MRFDKFFNSYTVTYALNSIVCKLNEHADKLFTLLLTFSGILLVSFLYMLCTHQPPFKIAQYFFFHTIRRQRKNPNKKINESYRFYLFLRLKRQERYLFGQYAYSTEYCCRYSNTATKPKLADCKDYMYTKMNGKTTHIHTCI